MNLLMFKKLCLSISLQRDLCSWYKLIKPDEQTALLSVSANWYPMSGIECITGKLELSMDLWKLLDSNTSNTFCGNLDKHTFRQSGISILFFIFGNSRWVQRNIHDFMQMARLVIFAMSGNVNANYWTSINRIEAECYISKLIITLGIWYRVFQKIIFYYNLSITHEKSNAYKFIWISLYNYCVADEIFVGPRIQELF